MKVWVSDVKPGDVIDIGGIPQIVIAVTVKDDNRVEIDFGLSTFEASPNIYIKVKR